MFYKLYNRIHKKDGKIANRVYAELKKFDKRNPASTFAEKQSFVKEMLLKIYGDRSNYSLDDILERKKYLETKLDNKDQMLSALALTFFTWCLCEYTIELIQNSSAFLTKLVRVLIPILFVAIALILASHWIAQFLCRQDTLYRKYNLQELELMIINKIIHEEYNYDNFKDSVVDLYFKSDSDK